MELGSPGPCSAVSAGGGSGNVYVPHLLLLRTATVEPQPGEISETERENRGKDGSVQEE